MTDVEEFLEHHGVKGQKWGITTRDLSRGQKRRLKSSINVSKGKGSTIDFLRVIGHQSIISLARGHGLKGAAARDAQKFKARQKKLKRGEDVVKNLLLRQGTFVFNLGGTK